MQKPRQARGAAKHLKVSRGAGGGLETVRKDLICGHPAARGWKVFSLELLGRLEVRGFCRSQGRREALRSI